ncbi:putative mitochondrial mitochondrial DNA polymerase I protein D [Leptomonas pyrrhocoris]|uniref:Putative mitochondrial mitochondrial DNA polymerase I protein D n=1 Tax=Leptomonas pyrrhocoris TaxID=157538 RepID=A0A0M9FUK7_LEPPY|nr:putative mitochondrial mitochondrial DNA polymerase I protein D [Leptomonas pyrrhocoris]KPA76333.1 putative mitochondrial mitochondrial DNA polymerase I protein D [Leptomonas pyrrhocoris]|eukprot:XP_015654772.1 putative mitochondrial mitochondrial DNA polymerase I protein D [Leptomonas pyrrhocoris]
MLRRSTLFAGQRCRLALALSGCAALSRTSRTYATSSTHPVYAAAAVAPATASPPSTTTATAAVARPTPVPYPARQNPFSPTLLADDQKVLLAKAQYCIFTLAYDAAQKLYAVYSATTNEVVVMKEEHIWKAAMWMDERIGEDYIAGLLFGCDASAEIKAAAALISNKAMKRVALAPDTWGITYLAFKAQQEVVRGVDLPLSLEHASFLLTQKQFNGTTVDPPVYDVEDGAFKSAEVLKGSGAPRTAVLSWDVLFNVHRRFGTPGSRKTLNPVEQIVRRVVKAVNVFVVDIDVRVGRGTITDGYTMVVTIYDSQKRSQSVHMIRSLAEETVKLNALTTLLYGEGSSSISLFVPTARTKASQLVAFARTCRPKSPFFVAEISSLAPYFGGQSVAKGVSDESDPRATWDLIRHNCFAEKHLRKEEDKMDRYLHRGFTALANKLFSDRLHKVSPAIMSAVNSIPPQEPAAEAMTQVGRLAEEAKRNPVPQITSASFLNKVNINDAEVVFKLQQWRSTIYEDAGRLEREKKAFEGLQRYLVVDLETTTIRRYKRVANPFIKENYVVLSGARDYKGNVFMPQRYFDRSVALRYDDPSVTSQNHLVEKSSKDSLFLPPLDDYDVIVGHNIKFDMLHLWRDVEFRKFLRRGGKIWDTMYGEYLLTGHEVKLGHGAGLEDVAKSYGGQTPKLDAVKRAWAEGKETYAIPYATLTEYLHGDLENTELVFCKHMERALEQRQVIICCARMEGLLCTTEMEYNGLKTNVELAQRQSSELMLKVADYRKQLENSIPAEIPRDCRKFFNWSSNQHLITFFFGGKLKLSTNARESKPLTGELFARHTLFLSPDHFPKSQYPAGVFMRPPVHVLGIGDCAIMAGMPTEKGTRMYRGYFDAYARQANFRKSSPIMDNLRREATAVSRLSTDKRGETSALANLLPRRHLFLFAALTPTSRDGIAKLFVKNPITGESVTIIDGDMAAQLEQFVSKQVAQHTEMVVSVDEDASTSDVVFADAHVTILARDAGFSFMRYLRSDVALGSYIDAHSGTLDEVEQKKRYNISFADTVSIFAYYRHQFADEPATTTKRTSKRTGGSGEQLGNTVIPAKALPRTTKRTKLGYAEAFKKMLLQEANMKPEEWCNHYIDVFLHIANSALQREALAAATTAAAASTKQRKSKKNEVQRSDDDLPVLLRQRRAFVGYYNSLPDAERKRLSLMCLVGKTISSAYDSFAMACSHDDVVTVNISGRLSQYVPNELEREQVMRRFRSSTTRQLQVGEDTLSYFKAHHADQTASVILELRALEKLIGTYYESTDGGTGMVSLVHAGDSCIHHELIHNKTNTGRLASANPNCQNIPKEDKSSLRDMFVSRFGDKGMCIEADYSQLEVVALAVLASDEQMLDDLRHNVDFHCKRVTMMRPDLKYTDVLQRAKKNKEPEFVKLRQQAKIFSFQRQYGAGVKMISHSTGLTQDQVRMLIEKENETYRGVEVFNKMVTLSANSYDASLQNGARNVRGHQFFKGMFPVLTGSRYIFTESDVPEGMLRERVAVRKSTNFSPTHLKNYPVQGFAGEIVQIILGVLWRHFLANNNYNGLAVLTNTVHDCVWVDCHVSVYKQVAKDVEMIMDSVRTVLNALYPEMQVSVDFPCDVVAGENMGALRPIMEETTL